jgi:hypothetical protein
VHLVAHVERLRDQRLQIDGAGVRERRAQRGRDRRRHRAQACEHLRSVGAEAQDLAQALVEVGERAIAGSPVLDDPQRHRRTDHARHRPHGRMVMARLDVDRAAREQIGRGRE